MGLFGKPEVMTGNWGNPTHTSRSYNAIVAAYLDKVGNVKNNTFVSSPENMPATKGELLDCLNGINKKFLVRVSLFTEDELDKYQAPHPLIGLLTVREFLYFTHYHTLRHWETIRKILKGI